MINKAIVLITDHKPGEYAFCKVAGASLFKRAIFSGQKAGIDEFFILYTGKNKHEIETSLKDDKRIMSKANIVNLSKEKDGGIEIHANMTCASGQNYFIINGNAIFDYSLLQRLSHFDLKDAFAAVSVDKRKDDFPERPGEWYIKLSNDNIMDISQDSKDCDGKTTGIILASPGAVSNLMGNFFSNPNFSLNEWMGSQIKNKELKAFNIKDNLSLEVVSEPHLRECEKRLYNSLGSSLDGPIVDKYINRKISRQITSQLVKTPITPNQTTMISLAIGIVSVWYFWHGGYWNYLAGALVFQLSFIFDQCDGEIARLKFMESKFGGWFDAVCDSVIRALMALGMTRSLYIESNQTLILISGILSSIGIFVSTILSSYETLQKEENERDVNKKNANGYVKEGNKLSVFVDKFNNTDSVTIILFICILSGHLAWFLWTIGIGSFAFSLVILAKTLIVRKNLHK